MIATELVHENTVMMLRTYQVDRYQQQMAA